MDYLDSLDLQTNDRKSSRVRSWYLYEQYKSLEKNQLDAAKKLKNRSYQEKILHRELSERRARRQFSRQFGNHQSESQLARSIKSGSGTPFSESAASFFESVCDQEDVVSEKDEEPQDSNKTSKTCKFHDEFISIGREDVDSCSESINSVIEQADKNKNVADEIKEELEFVKKNIAEIINLQRKAEKECLKTYTGLCDSDNAFENGSLASSKDDIKSTKLDKFSPKHKNAFLVMWSKLVSFAYYVMQTNRGKNGYNPFNVSLPDVPTIKWEANATATIAHSSLLLCLLVMCSGEVLVECPYVSPIKFVSDDSDDSDNADEIQAPRSNSFKPKKYTRTIELNNRPHHTFKFEETPHWLERKYRSEERWNSNRYSFENRMNEIRNRGASEPCRSMAKFFVDKNCRKNPTRKQCPSHNQCPCLKKAINPIIKLSRYIDMILQEIED